MNVVSAVDKTTLRPFFLPAKFNSGYPPMKELIKNFFIIFAMVGMICSCSGHRMMEENSLEMEETALEDVLARGEENERKVRNHERSSANRPAWELSVRPATQSVVRYFRMKSSCERDHLNGCGVFLLI